MNNVTIIGRVGRQPELRYTNGGTAVCEITIAVDGTDDNVEWIPIVTWGATVYSALEIAEEFDLEVIDLRTIVPMDDELVFNSVKKTSRVLVLHEDSITMGWGAEVVARIAANCFEHLDAPVLRLGAKDCFVPSAVSLEDEMLPSVDELRASVAKLLAY